MMKLLEFLFIGCWHQWETINEKEMVKTQTQSLTNGKENTYKKEYTQYTLRCKNCGEIKSVNVGEIPFD